MFRLYKCRYILSVICEYEKLFFFVKKKKRAKLSFKFDMFISDLRIYLVKVSVLEFGEYLLDGVSSKTESETTRRKLQRGRILSTRVFFENLE